MRAVLLEATPRGSGAWTMRLTNVTTERFDVPDNSDEAPRLSERAAARYVTSEHVVQTVIAAKPATRSAGQLLSTVRLSSNALLAGL